MADEGSSMVSAVFLMRCLWISYESRLRAGAKPFLHLILKLTLESLDIRERVSHSVRDPGT